MELSLRRAIVLSLLLPFGAPAPAQSAAELHASVELIAEQSTAPSGEPLWLGLLFRLDPGWHIYWQNPGDSGEPPKIQWQLPAGFATGPIVWPVPIRLGSGTVIDYGYEGQVLLMVPLRATSEGHAAATPKVSADVKYIVCREVCIPGKAHVTLTSGTSGGTNQWRAIFRQTRQQLPKLAPPDWKLSAESDKSNFVLKVRGSSRAQNASFFPLEPDQIDNSSPQSFASNRSGFQLTLKKSDQLTKPISRLNGLLIVGPGRAYEVSAPVASK